MNRGKKNLSITIILPLTMMFGACVDHYSDRRDFPARETQYRVQGPHQADQFVGSIFFATGSSALSKAALADLGHMADRLKDRRHSGRVILVGYADRKRGVEENAELAMERAQRVAMAIEKKGVALERLIIDSRAVKLTKPQATERRVDIFLEATPVYSGNALFPVLVAFFLLSVSVVAVLIFRRKR